MRKYIIYAIVKGKNLEDADNVITKTSPYLKTATLNQLLKEYKSK